MRVTHFSFFSFIQPAHSDFFLISTKSILFFRTETIIFWGIVLYSTKAAYSLGAVVFNAGCEANGKVYLLHSLHLIIFASNLDVKEGKVVKKEINIEHPLVVSNNFLLA